MKKRFFICFLLSLILAGCASAAGAGSPWDIAFSGENGRLEHLSLLPEDFSGYTIRAVPGDGVDAYLTAGVPLRTDEYGTTLYHLSEESARRFFRDAVPVSLGPGGAVLWGGVHEAAGSGSAESMQEQQALFFVQRDHELTVISPPSLDGDMADPDFGLSEEALSYYFSWYHPDDLRKYHFRPAEWSADGRYIYLDSNMSRKFLLDTRLGKTVLAWSNAGYQAFLTENCLERWTAHFGHFSADGRYLDLTGNIFYGSVTEGSYTETLSSGSLVRCDPASGSLTLCRLPDISGCSSIDETRLLTKSPVRLVTMDHSADPEIAAWPGMDTDCAIMQAYGGMTGPAAVTVRNNETGFPYAFSVLRNDPPWDNDWYGFPRDADMAEPFRKMRPEEMAEYLKEASTEEEYEARRAWEAQFHPILESIPVRDTPYLLLMVPGNTETIPSWPGYDYSRADLRFLLLNTGTMESRLLLTDSVWTDESVGAIRSSDSDPVIYGDTMRIGGTVFRLNPDADPNGGAGSAQDPVLIGLDSEPLGRNGFVNSTVYPHRYRVLDRTDDSLECLDIYLKVPGYNVTSRIAVLPEGFRLSVCFEKLSTHMVPAILTEERWKEIRDAMPNAKQRQKFSSSYRKIDSLELSKAIVIEELLQNYPVPDSGTLYVLRDNVREYQLISMEEMLRDAGYTPEDYAADMAYAPDAAAKEPPSGRVTYSFASENGPVQWTSGTVAGIIHLADYLSGTIFNGCTAAGCTPEGFDIMPLQGSYTFEYIPYHVTPDEVLPEEGTTVFTFGVIPAGGRGLIR